MDSLIVSRGHPLSGSIRVSSAKKRSTADLGGVLLTREDIMLYDCPRLRDVQKMIGILQALNVQCVWRQGGLHISPAMRIPSLC